MDWYSNTVLKKIKRLQLHLNSVGYKQIKPSPVEFPLKKYN